STRLTRARAPTARSPARAASASSCAPALERPFSSRYHAERSIDMANAMPSRMEIVDVEAIVLRTPTRDWRAADQTHEAALVRVTADDDSFGVGQAGVPTAVVQAVIAAPAAF